MEELKEEVCLSQGGIAKVEIALLVFPDTMHEIDFAPESTVYKRSRKRSKEGTKIVHSLDLNLIQGRPSIENWLLDYAESYFIIQVTDYQDVIYTMGTSENPAELLDSFNPGRNQADRNEYDFNFDCEVPL